jgi:hypothetical protein
MVRSPDFYFARKFLLRHPEVADQICWLHGVRNPRTTKQRGAILDRLAETALQHDVIRREIGLPPHEVTV